MYTLFINAICFYVLYYLFKDYYWLLTSVDTKTFKEAIMSGDNE